ncbi:MAG: HAD-IC family P-type ATPase, partial [Chloroflexi bacterium]|nr:HAD-IC family P-type ATPase [Chloroflexota bacterium]
MNSLLGKHWHHLSIEEVEDLLDTNIKQGIDQFEVKHRQEHFGPNLLTPKKGKSAFMRFLLQLNNPLVIILLAASAVTAILKDPTDALVIFGVVFINAIVGFVQESRAEQSIAALSKTMTTEAVAVRNGTVIRIPATELVPGDIVQLQAGARVPADLRLISSRDLQITEAPLTGESVPVEKDAALQIDHGAALAERRN